MESGASQRRPGRTISRLARSHGMDNRKEAGMRLKAGAAITVAACTALMAAGCSTIVEQRVDDRLVEAGLPTAMASCMAEIWTDELSVEQIRGIARFADAVREDGDRVTVGRLVDHASEWNDPRALGVVTTSAARCALG